MTPPGAPSKLRIVTGLWRALAATAILIAIPSGVAQPRMSRRFDTDSAIATAFDDDLDDAACLPTRVTVVVAWRECGEPVAPAPYHVIARSTRVLVDAPKTSPPLAA